MLLTKFNPTNKQRLRVGLLLALCLALLQSLIFSSTTHAANESYAYASSGQVIVASGGKFHSPGTARKSFGNTFSGGGLITNANGAACGISFDIRVTNTTSGQITARPAPPSSTNAGGNAGIAPCDGAYVSSLSEFKNATITVGGSTTDANPPSGVTPRPDPTAQQIVVTAYSQKPTNQLPGMQVSISGPSNETKSVSWNDAASVTAVRFEDKAAGTYQVCLTPNNTFSYPQCQSVTKVANTTLNVTFGSAETAYNENGKLVKVMVNVNIPEFTGTRTYGPIVLALLNGAGDTVKEDVRTGTTPLGADTGKTPAQSLEMGATIDGVEPGSYRVCITGTQLCSSLFTKEVNRTAQAVITVPVDQSDSLIAEDENTKTTCVIDGVGWIVCSMSRWLAQVMDGIYGLLTIYLTTPTVNTDINSESNTLYRVWSVMRNIANVVFVILFLIIIFSQLTSIGITNYNMKKLLPRLIVAAILVNVSYWVSAIAVDLSNILGSGIYNLIRGISNNLGGITIPVNVWEVSLSALLAGGSIAVVGGAVTATAAAVGAGVITGGTLAMAALWVAIPAVLAGILAVIIAFAILAARQALIIILIVLSPLAFVALLLPNTESYFKTWRKSLTTMLVFYPIFSVLFAGSQLAATIILSTAGGGTGEAVTSRPVGHIIILALFIQVIPLVMTPMLVKFSGGLIGQLAGMVNNKGKGLIDRSRKVRDRKLGLAANEIMGSAANARGRNPFARTARFMGRTYRRSQNDNRVDADRQKVLDSQNQGAYLETGRAAQLSTGLKNAQLEVQKLEAEHNAEFEVQKDVDLTYKLNLANQKVEASKLGDKKTYEESLSTSQAIAAGDPLAQQKIEARDTQRAIDVANNQLNFARSTIQQEYAKDLQADPVLANKAGGIDPHGEQKVVASAIEAQRKAYDANVAAFGVRLEGTDDTRLLNKAMTASTIEEREAAGRAIVKGGNIDTITEYQNYLATEFANAGSAGDANAVRDIQTLQRAYAATIGSSPGKPMGLGAAEIAQFNTGSYIAPSSTITLTQEYDSATGGFKPLTTPRVLNTTEIQTLSTVENKGVSMDKWASMDKSDIKRVIDLANVGAISATRATDMKKTIQDTLKDKRWSGRIQEREKKYLTDLMNRL